jgi:hypothetical protein
LRRRSGYSLTRENRDIQFPRVHPHWSRPIGAFQLKRNARSDRMRTKLKNFKEGLRRKMRRGARLGWLVLRRPDEISLGDAPECRLRTGQSASGGKAQPRSGFACSCAAVVCPREIDWPARECERRSKLRHAVSTKFKLPRVSREKLCLSLRMGFARKNLREAQRFKRHFAIRPINFDLSSLTLRSVDRVVHSQPT